MKIASSTLLAVAASLAALSTAQAGTILGTGFSATTTSISTTGTLGYGYFSTNNPGTNNGLFASGSTTEDGLFSTISSQDATPVVLTTVSNYDPTLTEIRTALGAQTPFSDFTFGGNQAYGAYGGFGGNAGDIWSLAFDDFAAGTYTISLYMGHTSSDRTFDMEAALTGATTVTSQSAANLTTYDATPGGGGGSTYYTFKYDITFTAEAGDDLLLTFGGIDGSTGGAVLAGYTVIPEPSAALLGSIGMLALLRRRRA